MKVSRNWLQSYFEKPIPTADQLSELFTLHSFEVEGMEKFAVPGDDVADDILDVKVLPDRAHYCLSHAGVALEVSALTGQPLRANRIPPTPADSLTTKVDVRIEAPQFCRRYMARYAEISEVKPSNPHAVNMLASIGQRAINAVVDATNVTMFDCGQPLHIFDADLVKGTIVVRAAKKGEKIMLLDGGAAAGAVAGGGLVDREVELLETDHVIADDMGPIAIAGVKGGKRAGVSGTTKRIIVESANFEPTAVRRTSTRLNLRSEASKRYENEITPELTALGMTSVCGLVAHNIPGTKFGSVVDIYPTPQQQTVIMFNPAMIKERLGVEVPLATAQGILKSLQIGIVESGASTGKAGMWELTIPLNRLDLTIPIDIVEEVGRLYGYEHVKGIVPPPTGKSVEVLPSFYISETIKDALVDLGFSEVGLYTLVAKGVVETAYPLARDKAFARANLADGMMACVERNALNADILGLDAIKIFEIGHIFTKDGEKLSLSLGAAQVKKIKGVKSETVLADALAKLGVSAKPVIKGVYAVVEIDMAAIIAAFKMPTNVTYNDINLGAISPNRYKKFSVYPFITRDIAVFVPEAVTAEQVWAEIQKGITQSGATKLVAHHALFDTFKKDGKTSFAFRMVFQADDRTLTDVETQSFMDAIYAAVRAQGWEVR